MTSKVASLKDALFDELISQVKDGVTIQDKEGEIVRLSVPTATLAVAAKVVKDFADEAKETEVKKSEHLSGVLARYSERKGVSAVQ